MCSFPTPALTNSHKFSGLKQHKCGTSQLCGIEVQRGLPGRKSRSREGCVPFRGLPGRICLFILSSSRRPPVFRDSRPLLPSVKLATSHLVARTAEIDFPPGSETGSRRGRCGQVWALRSGAFRSRLPLRRPLVTVLGPPGPPGISLSLGQLTRRLNSPPARTWTVAGSRGETRVWT